MLQTFVFSLQEDEGVFEILISNLEYFVVLAQVVYKFPYKVKVITLERA